jgi:predicted RNA binding protein YcfA (HicA-like mRNA interferase family)
MGMKEKLIERLKQLPKDFTFDEAERLLTVLGYVKSNKGRTSGSRVMFIDDDNRKILLHKPHPGNTLKDYALKEILDKLIRNGNI